MDPEESGGARRSRVADLLRRVALLVAIAACLPSVLALFARWSWFCDLFTHYRVYYAVVLLPLGFGLVFVRGLRLVAAGVLVIGLWNVALIVPLYVPPDAPSDSDGGQSTVRVLVANVNSANRRHDLVNALIAREEPDMVLLMEVNGPWLAAVEEVLSSYPHRVERPLDGNFGIALYSRLPFKAAEVREFAAELPSIVAEVAIEGRELTLIGTHPLPPMSRSAAASRNDQLQAMGRYMRQTAGARMLLGDLNTTSWSPHFGDLLATANLVDSRRGFGIQPTWIAVFGLIRLPIDHILVSPDVAVIDRRVGPDIGSDHRPVIVDLAW